MLLFGLRATEPCYLFVEHLDNQWLRVPCLPELSYYTKGRRGKRSPLLQELQGFWHELLGPRTQGLLYGTARLWKAETKSGFAVLPFPTW